MKLGEAVPAFVELGAARGRVGALQEAAAGVSDARKRFIEWGTMSIATCDHAPELAWSMAMTLRTPLELLESVERGLELAAENEAKHVPMRELVASRVLKQLRREASLEPPLHVRLAAAAIGAVAGARAGWKRRRPIAGS